MSNKQKYKDIFIKSLAMDGKKFNDNLKYNEVRLRFIIILLLTLWRPQGSSPLASAGL